MKHRLLLFCGILAPVVYVGTVIVGGAIRPGYSHIAQAVSELIESGAPNKPVLDALFIVYNLLASAFGLGMFAVIRARGGNKGKTSGSWGALLLVAIGVLGLAMTLFFPMDPRNAQATLAGTMHLVLAGIISLGTMLTILLIGLWLRNDPRLGKYWTYSLITDIVVFVSGGLAAASAASASKFMGFFERVTIGAFLQWVLVMALLPHPALPQAEGADDGDVDAVGDHL